jgi:hypothetical protein
MSWSPQEPEPSYVLDVPLEVRYAAQPPASLQGVDVHLGVRSDDAALNVTVAPLTLHLAPPPTGGATSGNATVHLRWLFPPAHDATSGVAELSASTDATPTQPAQQQAKAQMVVRYPGGLGGAPPTAGAGHAAPTATPLPAGIVPVALGAAALRRVHGRRNDDPACSSPRRSRRSPRS